MSKTKKKRTKAYHGRDAAPTPTVRHYTAEVRTPLQQWWFERKKFIRTIALVGGGTLFVGWLLFELFRMIL